jgi:hypothetical protein
MLPRNDKNHATLPRIVRHLEAATVQAPRKDAFARMTNHPLNSRPQPDQLNPNSTSGLPRRSRHSIRSESPDTDHTNTTVSQ